MRLNFLEVCLSPDLGGLELSVLDYFKFFASKASCKIVLAPKTKIDKHLESQDKLLLTRSKIFPLIPAIKLAKYIDKYDIDILHFHWTRDIATVVLAKLLSKKKPKLIQSRHMNMTRFKDDVYHRWLYKNIDMIHAVTKQLQAQLETYIPEDIRPEIQTIYLGVQKRSLDRERVKILREKYALHEDEFLIGMIGRVEDAKGQYLLIEALSQVKYLPIKALIVGAGMDNEYMTSLKEKVRLLALDERVIFTGFTQDIDEHIALCSVTVLATKKETFGLVVIESMLNGVPVIATNKGGPLEIIEEGVDGLFFDRTSEDLVEKIRILYNNKEFKEKLSLNAYKKVQKRFNKEIQMEKMYYTSIK